MKKVIMFAALLCCALSGFAEAKPIRLKWFYYARKHYSQEWWQDVYLQ